MGSFTRRRLASIRVRTTLAATLVVGVAAIVAGLVLVQVLRATLTHNLDALAKVRASDVATLMRSGTLRDTIPSAFEETSLVQVVDPAGHVIASSANLQGQSPILDRVSLNGGPEIRTVQSLPIGEGQAFRVVIEHASSGPNPVTILVATSLGPTNGTLHDVSLALLLTLPVLLVVVASTAWIMTGRTLRPVESIRQQVAEISTRELSRRVPVPTTSDEVERLARTMNSMLGRLEEARAREERFVADASHELRSPISAVRAQLETALAHQGGVEWPAVARTVLDEELGMERVISELLLLARADAGTLAEHRMVLDLRQLVQVELDGLGQREGVTLDASTTSEARVVGDPDQLARVIRNVVENAQRHAAGSVSVEVAVAGQNAEVIVADDGPGIPPADRERVFDRFTRLDEARSRRSGGVGLGLPIAKEIVTAHGGSIAVADAAKGARIVIRLPLASEVQARVHAGGPLSGRSP